MRCFQRHIYFELDKSLLISCTSFQLSASRGASHGEEGRKEETREDGEGEMGEEVRGWGRVPAHMHTHIRAHARMRIDICFKHVFAHPNPSFGPNRLIIKLLSYFALFLETVFFFNFGTTAQSVRESAARLWHGLPVCSASLAGSHILPHSERSVYARDRKPDTHAETISTNINSKPTRRSQKRQCWLRHSCHPHLMHRPHTARLLHV